MRKRYKKDYKNENNSGGKRKNISYPGVYKAKVSGKPKIVVDVSNEKSLTVIYGRE